MKFIKHYFWGVLFLFFASCASQTSIIAPELINVNKTDKIKNSNNKIEVEKLFLSKNVLIGQEKSSPHKLDIKQLVNRQGKPQLHIVIDTPYQIYSDMGTYVHLAVYNEDFSPASNAEVYMDNKLIGLVDETGTFVFKVTPNQNDNYNNSHNIIVVKEEGSSRKWGLVYFNSYPRTSSFENSAIYIYTDRGVYNPGQPILIRGIAWNLRGDFEPLADKNIELWLVNNDGNIVGGGLAKTDSWGILSYDIALPQHAPEGDYKLRAIYGETSEAKIRIERFVPPVIEIKHTLGRFLPADTKSLTFDVNLSYFGMERPFEAGKIKTTILKNTQELFKTQTDIKGAGPHKITISESDFSSIKSKLNNDDTVRVQIDVTDNYARNDTIKRDMRYVKNPYIVVVEMDKDQYTTDDSVNLILRVTDLDKAPVRDKNLKVVIGNKQFNTATDITGVAKVNLKMGSSDMSGNVFIEGINDPVSNVYLPWNPLRPMVSQIPEAVVKERRETKIIVDFPHEYIPMEKNVHVDLIDYSGALVYSFLIPISQDGNTYKAQTTFPSPQWGSMLLTMFCIGKENGTEEIGLLTEGQNLPVIPDRELRFELKGLKEIYSPGEEIEFIANIKNRDEKTTEAALGAGIVDEAVLSLLDPLEITPSDKFYNPTFKVMSTTGSKILTWPVVSRNWGDSLYDIALPPFGYRNGGKINTGLRATMDVTTGGIGYGGAADGDYPDEEAATLPPAPPSVQKQVTSKSAPGVADGFDAYEYEFDDEISQSDLSAKRARVSDNNKQPSVKISIRTNFAETSLWAPHLISENGQITIKGKLPDSLTTQRITLVASNKTGEVGFINHKIKVFQDIYARGDLPPVLTDGDSVEVNVTLVNNRKSPVNAKLSLQSSGFVVQGNKTQSVQAGANSSGVVTFKIKAAKTGIIQYKVVATGEDFSDEETKTLYIRPAGFASIEQQNGKLNSNNIVKFSIAKNQTDYTTAFLSIKFPNIFPAIQGVEALFDRPGGAIDFIASQGLGVASLYKYLSKRSTDEQLILNIKKRTESLLVSLLMSQNRDGGWGWHFPILRQSETGKTAATGLESNPFMTAQVLESLEIMQESGIRVPQDAFSRAVSFLFNSNDSDGYWSIKTISFWEGSSEKVKQGISANVFRVLAKAGTIYSSALPYNYQTKIKELTTKYNSLLPDKTTDPLTLSNVALGVNYTNNYLQKIGESVSQQQINIVKQSAKNLLNLRTQSYWEPSWFFAYGGTILATKAAIELLKETDLYEDEMRQAILYLASTQNAWGEWHNAIETAAAIEAVLMLPNYPQEKASQVELIINGRNVKQINIDPQNPFMSAVSVRMVEISDYLKTGQNEVQIRYNGNLEANCSLITQRWGNNALKQSNITLTRDLNNKGIRIGQPVQITLNIKNQGKAVPMEILEPLPSASTVSEKELKNLITNGVISNYQLEKQSVRFFISNPQPVISIPYTIELQNKGRFIQPSTLIYLTSQDSSIPAVQGEQNEIIVE